MGQIETGESGNTIERVLAKPKTVAIMTDQSVSMVYKLVADGTYPSVRIGHSVRIPLDKLRRVLSRLTEPTAGGAANDPHPRRRRPAV